MNGLIVWPIVDGIEFSTEAFMIRYILVSIPNVPNEACIIVIWVELKKC